MNSTETAGPDGSAFTEGLGLAAERGWGDPAVQAVYDLLCDCNGPPDPALHWEGWIAAQIVNRVLAPAVANERARIAASLRKSGATLPAPEINGTPESGIITGLCIALTLVEDGPNVEFSGVPAGHSSNHPAGGTSAGTQG